MKNVVFSMFLVLIVASPLFPAHAQTETCELDLDALSAILQSAQDELEDENYDLALTFMELADDMVADAIACEEEASEQITLTVTVANANVRVLPMGGDVVDSLEQGSTQVATGRTTCDDGIWIQIEYEGQDNGVWIRSDLISLSADVDTLPEIEANCVSETVNSTTPTCATEIRYCARVTLVTVNDINLSPSQQVPAGMVNFQNVTIEISQDNLNIIETQSGGLSYVYAQVIPMDGDVEIWDVDSQATPSGGAIDPLYSGSLNLSIDNTDWDPQPQWDRYLVLILHYNSNLGVEQVIGSALFTAN